MQNFLQTKNLTTADNSTKLINKDFSLNLKEKKISFLDRNLDRVNF